MNRSLFYWLWAGWLLYFGIVEGIALWYEIKLHAGDKFTFTHFLASQLPMSLRVAFMAWLVYHFLIVHINS